MKYNQNGVLDGVEPGKRVKGVIDSVRPDSTPDMSQAKSMVPDDPGPSVAGKSPVIGSLRRERGIPVARDQLPSLMD